MASRIAAAAASLARTSRRGLAAAAATPPPPRWSGVPQGPPDAILGVTQAFGRDPSPRKINLGVGAYRDDDGAPYVLPSVREAEARVTARALNMEYLPVAGHAGFLSKAMDLAYGEGAVPEGLASVQTLSGTGACRLAGDLLARFAGGDKAADGADGRPLVLLPNPSWANHAAIFRDAGCAVGTYTYYEPSTKSLNLEGMLRDLRDAPRGATVLLHACAHNPTGVDPDAEAWGEISAAVADAGLHPLFDMAYQGFTSGDPAVDAAAVRRFVADGHAVVLAQSFSKNFGLYGHRVGALSVMTGDAAAAAAVSSQLCILGRPSYSNPPLHGVRLVDEVLGDAALAAQWREEVAGMATRIAGMRTALVAALADAGSTADWRHVTDQNGMFCYSGMSADTVARLAAEWSVYLTSNGRISMAGVTSKNVGYLAEAMHAVTKDGQ